MSKKIKPENRKILVLGGVEYFIPFENHGLVYAPKKALASMDEIENADLIVFTGGADVSPSLYKDSTYLFTKSNLLRDREEATIFDIAVKMKIPMAGICRGSQLLTALCGGTIIQHVTGHGASHEIMTTDKKKLMVTSTHHQMMNPWIGKLNFELLAWSTSLSDVYYSGEGTQVYNSNKFVTEPEVVWYPDKRCLAVQYHPEYMNKDSNGWKYYQKLIKKYLLVK